MNTITDVRQIPGFDQQRYDALISEAKVLNVDIGLVTSSLLEAVNGGKNFDEAVKLTAGGQPKLAPPDAQLMANLANWPTMPSPGAAVMALITEISAEQRQQNKELMWAQTEAVVDSMENQAKEMRKMAAAQFVLGLAGAVATAAGGIAQSAMAVGGKNPTAEATTLQSTKAQGVGTAVGSASSLMNSASQFIGSMYQAKFKGMEADQEKMRAMRDSLKDLNDGLKELIQKSLSNAESIQQGKNQATTRILA